MAFENLKKEKDIKDQGDNLGGMYVFPSDVYKFKINMAYQGLSKGGANSLNMIFRTADGREFRYSFWVTSGTEKGAHHYYFNKAGDKQYLPGFLHANSLALLTTGKPLFELATEDKTIKLYDFDAKKEIPTVVPVFTELLDKEIALGLIQQIIDKNIKNDEGKYVPSGETREDNEVDKVFRASDGMTVVEIEGKSEEAEFVQRWADKWRGQVRNRAKGAAEGGAPTKGGAAAGAAKAKAAPSLWD